MKPEYDFSNATRAKDVPHLAALRARHTPSPKTRISIMIDSEVLEAFKALASVQGKGYQSLMHDALANAIAPESAPVTVATLRAVLDEKLAHGANR